MKITWLTIKMLLNSGYVEQSNPLAIKRNFFRAGYDEFPRVHIIKDGKWDIHIDLKKEHGKTFGFGGMITKGELIDWELARIKKIHFEKEFKKLPQESKLKKKLDHLTNFYNL